MLCRDNFSERKIIWRGKRNRRRQYFGIFHLISLFQLCLNTNRYLCIWCRRFFLVHMYCTKHVPFRLQTCKNFLTLHIYIIPLTLCRVSPFSNIFSQSPFSRLMALLSCTTATDIAIVKIYNFLLFIPFRGSSLVGY